MTPRFSVNLPSGREMPTFGLGTWHIGEHKHRRSSEVDALRYGLDLGVQLIDTAEMYGEGGAEEVISDAIDGRRDRVFIVSKVYPHNASYKGVLAACERSLRRLKTDYIDLYLLHWPGSIPLAETFEAFHFLRDAGTIKDFGVSNFDVDDLQRIPEADVSLLGTNQVFYNLARREAEWAVLPWCRQHQIPAMAYSPLDQGGPLLDDVLLKDLAVTHRATTAQIALAWLLHQEQVVVIPKSSQLSRVKENFEALGITLTDQDLADLDRDFPGPRHPVGLGMR